MGLLEIFFYVKDLSINVLDVFFLLGNINIGFFGEGEIFIEWFRFKIEVNFLDINGLKGGFDIDILVLGVDILYGKMRGFKV